MKRYCLIAITCSLTLLLAADSASGVDFTLRPVRASGMENIDWMLGPGEREITLASGGQDVEFKVYISNWAPALMAAYQVVVDCDSLESDRVGEALAIDLDCTFDEGEFGDDYCMGVDEADPDYPFFWSLPACSVLGPCPSGAPGMNACGSVSFVPILDPGMESYAAQFAFHTTLDLVGSIDIGFTPDPELTFATDEQADPLPINMINTGRITVLAGACCTPEECVNDVSPFACDEANGMFHPDQTCGNDVDNDGVADTCDLCPGANDAEDNDGDGNPNGCDPCPVDFFDDSDGDGLCDGVDSCPGYPDGQDQDGDGVPDGCDVCPGLHDIYNPACIQAVPTVTGWGLSVLALSLLAVAKIMRPATIGGDDSGQSASSV